jgi:putative transposase
VLPHAVFRGQTPDEMYFGTGPIVPADLKSGAVAARRARCEANRSASCDRCRSTDVAAWRPRSESASTNRAVGE